MKREKRSFEWCCSHVVNICMYVCMYGLYCKHLFIAACILIVRMFRRVSYTHFMQYNKPCKQISGTEWQHGFYKIAMHIFDRAAYCYLLMNRCKCWDKYQGALVDEWLNSFRLIKYDSEKKKMQLNLFKSHWNSLFEAKKKLFSFHGQSQDQWKWHKKNCNTTNVSLINAPKVIIFWKLQTKPQWKYGEKRDCYNLLLTKQSTHG